MSIMDAGANIFFVAVARAHDGVIVASYVAREGDYNKPQYFNTVNEVLSAPDFSAKVAPGSRYRLVGNANAFNFTSDNQGRVYIAITTSEYPERLAFPMLQVIIERFTEQYGPKSLTVKEGGLNKKSKQMFAAIVKEYDDPAQKDKVAAVQAKVEDVKLTMQSNIDGMLRNIDKTEKIESDTQQLQDQAKLFDTQATTLKKKEQWKSRKLTLLIIAIIAIILTVLIVTLVKS
uniref:Synaptobrevin-like protein n=2 Tax=Sar TaxID=2698737 RepID=A0A7S2RZL7_9STRA|mmetsp:Transcript_6190/g.9743  ORF Transcript_6190/g.9743 Transcript_6190/m.9743 type:complete len:232 (-) Transcript_6190:977-1672(-)|eukprot:CAMPEP_0203747504 /NCGR_PEP_ID=MMETSP0098-20131031/2625_1 /ASSEMBLY_ACC=CAM_ASM_000208 /TAXON_ID=96639 /ORGANISM=" , Strain NY0313808BC1" /LENGTH=231 /DNA_ID=CAMNT_0050635943 /DNA_START=250 /DNA_END=945 /DNA_ORIENTATION=+